MIDFDKAIELFRHHDIVRFILTGLGESEYKTVEFKDVVDSLEKQMPKEPIYKENGNIECPSCNCEALRYHNYCWNCGQALKWGDAE